MRPGSALTRQRLRPEAVHTCGDASSRERGLAPSQTFQPAELPQGACRRGRAVSGVGAWPGIQAGGVAVRVSCRWGRPAALVPDCPVALSPAGHAAHAGGPHPGHRQLQHRGLRRPGHVPALFRVAAGGVGLRLCSAARAVTVTLTPLRVGPAIAAGAPSRRRPIPRAPPDMASLSSKPSPGCSAANWSPGGRGESVVFIVLYPCVLGK